jgi:hypothetical protein
MAGFIAFAGRDLDWPERRRLLTILGVALAARLALIGAETIRAIPFLNDLSVGALRGDDLYYVGRALRTRDILLGVTQGKYDYFMVYDEYGRTSYLQVLTFVQTLFGPSPYGLRAMNALPFVVGAYLLFRLVRRAYGATAAAFGLTVVLFLPSLFVASTSLLKESTYFFISALLVTVAIGAVRDRRLAVRVMAVAIGAACLWAIEDLRRGAQVLAIAGLATAALMRMSFETPRRALVAAIAALLIVSATWLQPALHARALAGVVAAAKTHGGHVFTVGHAYKLLDDGFYMYPSTPLAWTLELTDAQAARFLVRAAQSFLFTPWPWQIVSRSELAFLPEHLVWLLIVVLLPAGAVAGWRRDPLVTSVLIGFVLPTAAALAVTNGNVGTLLRLRGLVSPFLIWVAVIGGLRAAEYLLGRRTTTVAQPAGAWT